MHNLPLFTKIRLFVPKRATKKTRECVKRNTLVGSKTQTLTKCQQEKQKKISRALEIRRLEQKAEFCTKLKKKMSPRRAKSVKLEFFFDVSSQWTYLAFSRIRSLARDSGASLIYRPFLVGGVFNEINKSVYERRKKHGSCEGKVLRKGVCTRF